MSGGRGILRIAVELDFAATTGSYGQAESTQSEEEQAGRLRSAHRERSHAHIVQEDGAGGISPVKENAGGSAGRGFGKRKVRPAHRPEIGGVFVECTTPSLCLGR